MPKVDDWTGRGRQLPETTLNWPWRRLSVPLSPKKGGISGASMEVFLLDPLVLDHSGLCVVHVNDWPSLTLLKGL